MRRFNSRHRGASLALLVSALLGACDDSENTPTAPPPPPPPPASQALWGAVGCSQTQSSIEGYVALGGTRSWPPSELEGYGGGDVLDWADLSGFRWDLFQAALDAHGAAEIWWEICVTGGRDDPVPTAGDFAAVESIAEEIRRRAPDVPIFASAVTDYVGVECWKTGEGGVQVSRSLVDHVLGLGLAQPGPIIGPLDETTTAEDGKGTRCSFNEAGRTLVGGQLLAFFG